MPESAVKELRNAAVTMVAVLASFFAAFGIRSLFSLQADVEVMAVAVTLTSARTRRGGEAHERLRALVVFPVVALLASGVGELMRSTVWAGDAVYVLALSGAIWVRRFGPRYTRLGTLVALPFIVVLIAPAPPGSGAGHAGGTVLIAAASVLIVNLVQILAQRLGLIEAPPPQPLAPKRASASAAPSSFVSVLLAPRRWAPSSRMALQMAAGLAAAFAAGHLLWPSHWSWTVLSAYIVASGNRGRGDVVHKSGLRIVGAGAGAVIATLLAGLFTPGDSAALVVLFGVMALALWLRSVSYALWAGGVSAMLALLYGYFGEGGNDLILQRVEGIIVGALIAVACAWFIAPIKTSDVLRRRLADYVLALRDFLAAVRERDVEQMVLARQRLQDAAALLAQIAPTLKAHRTLVSVRGRPQEHPHDIVVATAGHNAMVAEITEAAIASPQALSGPEVGAQLATLREAAATIRQALARSAPGADSPAAAGRSASPPQPSSSSSSSST